MSHFIRTENLFICSASGLHGNERLHQDGINWWNSLCIWS